MWIAVECFDDNGKILGTIRQDEDFWEVYHQGYYIRCVLTLNDAIAILKEKETES